MKQAHHETTKNKTAKNWRVNHQVTRVLQHL